MRAVTAACHRCSAIFARTRTFWKKRQTDQKVKTLLPLLGLVLALLNATESRAQGRIIDHRNRPTAAVVSGRDITAAINHQVASVTVETDFYNPGGTALEGTFVFPLPAGASVSKFSLEIDGEPVSGEILEAGKARRIYEDIVRNALDPALLEWADHAMFRARVFPIGPRQTRRISLRYDVVLDRTADVVRVVFPLTNNDSASKIKLDISSDSEVRSIYSPTHDLRVDRKDPRSGSRVSVEATRALSESTSSFVLYYSLGGGHLAATIIPHRPYRDRPGYFMLMLDPPPKLESATVEPTDILFVLDTSGSMAGGKIEQAKGALSYALNRLGDRDRFAIITFSSDVSSFSDGLSSVDAVDDALYFVDRLEARGGTNINEALLQALDMIDADRRSTIVFLTDGLPSTGETSIEKIRTNVEKANEHEARIFPFGVGYDVNTQLLDGIARSSSAVADYIAPDENVEERVSGFYERTRYPAMTDVEVRFDGVRTRKLAPRDPGDVFFGSTMVLTGRYDGPSKGFATVSGFVGGERVTQEIPLDFPAVERQSGFVARIWATRRIGELLESIRLEGESDALKDEVIALATEFGIVTPYTSYLVREDDRSIRFDVAMESSSGREAVALSRQLAGFQQAKQAFDIGGPPAATVQGQTLIKTSEGVWSSQANTADFEPLDVQFGSEAYCTLARLYPETAGFLRLGKDVSFVLRNRLVRIGASGLSAATESEVRAWFSG